MRELSEIATSLVAYCGADKRVCPRGDKWQQLWEMLPEDATQTGWQRTPPLPLILSAASLCEPWEKRLRMKDHISWADKQGVIAQADALLRGLTPDEWEYSSAGFVNDNSYDDVLFAGCISDDDVECMKKYLAEGINPEGNFAEYSVGNALVLAAEAGAVHAVAYLLSIGVKLDPAAIGASAVRGHDAILNLLLDAGMVPDSDSLCSVAGTDNVQALERLLEAGAPINDQTGYGWHALHNATVEDQTKIVEALLRAGANPNISTSDGTTPLMLAACGSDVTMVELLLNHGASVEMQNKDGETALDLARGDGWQAAVALLEMYRKE